MLQKQLLTHIVKVKKVNKIFIMGISIEQVKKLRDQTSVSIMQCKKALEEANGDEEKALILLKKKSSDIAAKKADRELGAGAVGSYVHSTGTIGAMVLLACETDFVAKNEEFTALAHDIAMQVAAMVPSYITVEEIPTSDKEKASLTFAEEVAGKPDELKAQILSGKVDAYFKDQVLMTQSFFKDSKKTIADLITEATQKFGERIAVSSMSRIAVGD